MGSAMEINVKNSIICISILIIVLYSVGLPIFGRSKSFILYDKVNVKNLISVSIEMAVRGGKRVTFVRNSADIGESSKGQTKEGKNDVLTAGDLQSHLTIMAGFKKAFPSLNVYINSI